MTRTDPTCSTRPSRPTPRRRWDGATTYHTPLAWIALAWNESRVSRLTFGHSTRSAAMSVLQREASVQTMAVTQAPLWAQHLLDRFHYFADGAADSFLDVPLAWDGCTSFQRLVLTKCRQIPYGQTRSYSQLATQAGRPNAARAVGNVMAKNRFPLVVPCHRVTAAGGALGGFSAPSGLQMKRRLLRLEGSLQSVQPPRRAR